MNMNLTNQEMVKIHEITSRQHSEITAAHPDTDSSIESYFRDRNELKLFECTMIEYSFETPMELIGELKKMWEYQDVNFMFEFINVCAAAAFKYRNHPANEEQTKGISSFIYEF